MGRYYNRVVISLISAYRCVIASTFSTAMSTTESSCAAVSTHHHNWLVVDFDGTCTERDTTPLLPKLTAVLQGDNETEQRDRLTRFKELENEFLSLFATARKTLDDDKAKTLEEALSHLDEPSEIITHKVSESGILHGLAVSADKIADAIQSNDLIRDHVRLKPDCLRVLERVLSAQQKLGILSINWCPALIEAVLLRPIAATVDVPIWSNQIESGGRIALLVAGALSKKERIARLREQAKGEATIVYIGDSSTDLAALIEADVGILIGESKSTFAMARQWGISLVPLTDRSEPFLRPKDDADKSNVIWLAGNWSEIGELF